MIVKAIKVWWQRKGPWEIGRIAVHTNTESGWLCPIGSKLRLGNLCPVGSKLWLGNRGPLWREWGTINFKFRVLWFWVCFRVAVGDKSAVIPRWMAK